MQPKETKESEYVLLTFDKEEYFSLLLMPRSLYDKLSDIMVAKEDWESFWESKAIFLNYEEFFVFKERLFKGFGVRASITDDNKYVYILGSLPQQIVSYLREVKFA